MARHADITLSAALVRDWLAARSVSRGLPAPVFDRGGYRVDTGDEAEAKRWVFAEPVDGIRSVAQEISQPGFLIKLCGSVEQLRPMLPPAWQVQASGFMMAGPGLAPDGGKRAAPPCPPGYTLDVQRSGAVTHIRILAPTGALAASGYCAETDAAFVIDRIATELEHRRLGLARLVVQTLLSHKRRAATPELLVATDAGCALYQTMGWRILSPYTTGHAPVA